MNEYCAYDEFEILCKREADDGEHALKRVRRVIDPVSILAQQLFSCSERKKEKAREKATYATKTSGRSRYCQYSRFGIGSKSEAGNERRLKGEKHIPVSIHVYT